MAASVPSRTGTVPFTHSSLPVGVACFTSYRIFGDLSSSARPIVTLHGGPGGNSSYMLLGLDNVPAETNRPVILYDQIGNGLSTALPDQPADFWTIDLFVAELDNLVTHLGIKGGFDLVGHSWGGFLGPEYILAHPEAGVGRLVLVGAPASAQLWVATARRYVDQMPEEVRRVILQAEEGLISKEGKEYEAAIMEMYKRHLCRCDTWPREVEEVLEWLGKNPSVYVSMWGASEIDATGSLKDWDISTRAKNLTLPTLVLHGELDFADKTAVEPWVRNLPNVQQVTMSGCSHMPMAERPEEYHDHVIGFLQKS